MSSSDSSRHFQKTYKTHLCIGVRPNAGLLALINSGFAFCDRITAFRCTVLGGCSRGPLNAGPDIDIRPVLVGFLIVEGTGSPEPCRALP